VPIPDPRGAAEGDSYRGYAEPLPASAGLALTRRELVVFGLGAVAGAAAAFAGCLLALAGRRDKPPEP
jgi:hypothetical protein